MMLLHLTRLIHRSHLTMAYQFSQPLCQPEQDSLFSVCLVCFSLKKNTEVPIQLTQFSYIHTALYSWSLVATKILHIFVADHGISNIAHLSYANNTSGSVRLYFNCFQSNMDLIASSLMLCFCTKYKSHKLKMQYCLN